MWPGFNSRRRRHMWVEFVVGSLPCFERFFSRYSGFFKTLSIGPISWIEPTTYRSKVKRSLRDSRGFWTPCNGFQILGTVLLDFSLCQSLSLDSGFLSFVGSQSLGFPIPRAKFFGFFDQDSHALPTHHSPHHFVPGPRGPGTGTRLHGFLQYRDARLHGFLGEHLFLCFF